ncbi:MAG: ATP-binding protein [Bdellovibrionota bacterium]
MKFHWRITLGALFVSAIAAIAAALYIGPSLRRSVTREVEDLLRERLLLTSHLIEEFSSQGPHSPEELQKRVESLAADSRARITLIATDGKVLADSAVPFEKLPAIEPHGGRPEVIEAFGQGEGSAQRHSSTVGTDLLYVARRIQVGGFPVVVRLAHPLLAVDQAVADVRGLVWSAVGIAFLLTCLLSFFLSRQVSKPVEELTAATRRLTEGDLTVRLQARSSDELGELARNFNRMAERLDALLARLKTEQEQAERILSTVHEGIVLLDEEDRLAAANRSFISMFRLEGQDLTRRLPLELVRSNIVGEAVSILRDGKESFEGEFTLEEPEGTRSFELAAAQVVEGGRRRGSVLVFRDITRTERLEQVRKDFVANVSHELRTPLTSIRGYAETLAKKLTNQTPLDGFAIAIVRSAESLSALVNDLLDLSRLERPDFLLERHEGDLAEAIRSQADLFRERFAQKSIAFSVDMGGAPPRASFDRRLLEQVLSNLFDNAAKYTPAGGNVWVRLQRDARGDHRVEVANTGLGIPPQDLPRIFERFYRVDKGRSRELGGTGLGLAIVKHIIARHGGEVGVYNRSEGGCCFWFTLPAEPAPAALSLH